MIAWLSTLLYTAKPSWALSCSPWRKLCADCSSTIVCACTRDGISPFHWRLWLLCMFLSLSSKHGSYELCAEHICNPKHLFMCVVIAVWTSQLRRKWRQGRTGQWLSTNLGPVLYRGASVTRATDLSRSPSSPSPLCISLYPFVHVCLLHCVGVCLFTAASFWSHTEPWSSIANYSRPSPDSGVWLEQGDTQPSSWSS